MQFRFINEADDGKKKLLGYCDIDDYTEAFKLFTFMMDHRCEFAMMINTEDIVDTEGKYYKVNNISFVSPKVGGELGPYIMVLVEEEW